MPHSPFLALPSSPSPKLSLHSRTKTDPCVPPHPCTWQLVFESLLLETHQGANSAPSRACWDFLGPMYHDTYLRANLPQALVLFLCGQVRKRQPGKPYLAARQPLRSWARGFFILLCLDLFLGIWGHDGGHWQRVVGRIRSWTAKGLKAGTRRFSLGSSFSTV